MIMFSFVAVLLTSCIDRPDYKGERLLLRFAPSTENGLPLIWARPRFCEDTFSRLNKEETEKVAGERCMRGEIFPSE